MSVILHIDSPGQMARRLLIDALAHEARRERLDAQIAEFGPPVLVVKPPVERMPPLATIAAPRRFNPVRDFPSPPPRHRHARRAARHR